MDSRHLAERIDGYLDGEFDLATSLEIERHLQGCPDCRNLLAERRALSDHIRLHAPRFSAPERLVEAVRSGIRAEGDRPRRSPWRPALWAAAAVLAVVTLGAAWLLRPDASETLQRQVAASHVRALLVDSHRVDVASGNAATLRPWFQAKLDYLPPVQDWAADGYALTGGRIDYVDGRPVAVLVYRRGAHVISVSVWPAAESTPRDHRTAARDGTNLLWWREGDLQYWLASDATPTDLLHFHHLIEGRPSAG